MLGATGSIGESTLDLIGRHPGSYQVVALTGGQNAARLAELGGTALALSPAQFGKLIADDTEKWGKVIRAANIKPD